MNKEFVIKKCTKCGAMVEVLKDCTCDNCGIKCCGMEMEEVKANTVDASIEKHKPVVEVVGSYIIVTVPHVMEEAHYIDWIALSSETVTAKKVVSNEKAAKAIFPYIKGSVVYSYCNLHGLWSTVVE